MSQDAAQWTITKPSAGDLTGKAHLFCVLTTGKIAVAGAGADVIGIIQENPPAAADRAVKIMVPGGGTSKLVVDGNAAAILTGDWLKSDAAGKGVKTVTNLDKVGARALEASTADGDIIEVIPIAAMVST